MAQYVLYGSGRMNNSPRFLLGPPLVVISVFCFAFVMMHPHASVANHSLATDKQTTRTDSSTPAKLSLPDSSQALATPGSTPPSTTSPPASPPSSESTTPTTATTNPQSAGSIATKLQAAIPNNQPASNSGSNPGASSSTSNTSESNLVEVSLPLAKNLLKTLTTLK